MSMFRIKKDKDNPYVMLNKEFLNDEKLSWKSKGVLSYLLTLPDDWQIYETEISKHSKDGKDSLKSAMKELIDLGYIVRGDRKRDEKGMLKGYEYTVYERSIHSGKTYVGKPNVGKPATTNIDLTNIDLNNINICPSDDRTITSENEINKKDNKELIEATEKIWKLYPRKEGRKAAFKKIPKLIKQYGKEQIEMCVRRYDLKVYTEKIPKKYIQMGSTFFNSGYMDYLDEYYKQEDNTEIEEKVEVKEEIEQPKQPKKQEKTIKLEEMF